MIFASTDLYLQQNKLKICEGKLRCEELKTYLEKIKAPSCVWISEDASGIIQKCVYDVQSNKIIGLNLPIHADTGIPISSTFIANSLLEIENHMKKPLSHLVYLVMAQPVMPKSPPFVLQIFGTDSRFTTKDVLNRWQYTTAELKK